MQTDLYRDQSPSWPASGRHILAQYDDESIIVYQAYAPEIGLYAAKHGRFGSPWSRTRMTWIKPNFLWMMYRCGWATKPNQEIVLAIRLLRAGFDKILKTAVPSAFVPELFADQRDWSDAVAESDVRLQWDPDHEPYGKPLPRRALQLGIRRAALQQFTDEWIIAINDITPLVREQHEHVLQSRLDSLRIPAERVYPVSDPATARRLGVGSVNESSSQA